MGKIRVGLSGWSYDEWEGGFYPDDLASEHRLRHVAERFDTVEVNGTFYGLTDPATVRRWRSETPSEFVFAVKGSRYVTHIKRLKGVDRAVANFFAQGVLELGGQLGPILWQLPPRLRFDHHKLDSFLALLPHTTNEASELARSHDDRVEDVSFGDGSNHRVRNVVEFRDPSFLDTDAVALAKRHSVAVACSASTEWPMVADVTAGFVYVRLHGPGEIYASRYSEDGLRAWARRCEAWRDGDLVHDLDTTSNVSPPKRKTRDVYVYFDNTARGHAPGDARRLQTMIDG